MNATQTEIGAIRQHNLREIQSLRERTAHDIGAAHELVRDRAPRAAASRLRELAESLNTRAKLLEADAELLA